jgi:hypothetical protein
MDVDEGGPRLECLVSGLDLLGGRDRDGEIGGDYAGYNRLYL